MQSEKKRNILIFFASVSLNSLSRQRRRDRDDFYAMCLAQVRRVSAQSPWDILVVENTFGKRILFEKSSLGREAHGLQAVIVEENRGTRNKGLGELDMLGEVVSQVDLDEYKNVAYFTGRRIMTSPYPLRIAEENEGAIVAGNPGFLYLDGQYSPPSQAPLLADMFFTMPPRLMVGYSDFVQSELHRGLARGIGSEQLLFQYINNNNLSFVPLDYYGFVRLEMSSRRGRWHIC